MNREAFEKILSPFRQSSDAEAFWDEGAARFEAAKKTYGTQLTEKVLYYLTDKALLTKNSAVLDIGCGAGRYALPFAAVAERVTATDISANMLKIVAKSAKAQGLDNLETLKSDWQALDRFGGYDLVFASMSPVMQSLQGLRLMSKLSRGYCTVARYISMRDPAAEVLRQGSDRPDPHQGREEVWAIFNLLWLEGWQPEITYLERICEAPITLEQAAARYMYAQQDDLREKLADFLDDEGRVVTKSTTTLALITWQVGNHKA